MSSNLGKSQTMKEILEWIIFVIGALACAFIINKFIIFNAYIPSGSMENTIMTGDRVIGLRLTYLFSKPQRYDVAIFLFPDNEKEYYVKRVVGMPGETLEIKAGKIYINGSDTPLDDHFVKEPPIPQDLGPYEIPEGCYFMMGDNRNRSVDARMWTNTFVKEEKILAKAYWRLWPKPGAVK